MKDKLTFQEMQDLINCNLYAIDGMMAVPNYRYLKPDAPVYRYEPDGEGNAFTRQTAPAQD